MAIRLALGENENAGKLFLRATAATGLRVLFTDRLVGKWTFDEC